MKKIVLILSLVLHICCAESFANGNSEVGKWRKYFGVEGGAGIYGTNLAFIIALNPAFFPQDSYFGLGYSGGILGGWQKYTKEKIGMRNTLGFAFSYVPNVASIQKGYYEVFEICIFHCKNQVLDFRGSRGQTYDFYYALDGLFDFIKEGRNHWGMSLGFSLSLLGSSGQSGQYDRQAIVSGFAVMFGMRLGLYAQLENNIFELMFKAPLLGVGAGNPFMAGNVLMLGYKHFI